MKTCIILSILCICLAGISCKKESATAPETKQVQLTEKQQQVVDKSNSFGFDFFRKVNEASSNQGNLMISPLSVSMALGMTRNGAAGGTLEAMTQTLGLAGLTDEEINESYKYILETFKSLDPEVKLSIANSIWYRDGFSVEPLFIKTNQTYFQSSVTPLNFADPQALVTINNWVSDNTNQLIPKVLDEISGDVVMYLINAVYFKGQWKHAFDQNNTKSRPFRLADGTAPDVESMVQHSDLQYYEGDGFEAVELPYNQGNYNMVVLLPSRQSNVNDLIGRLSQANWNLWYSKFVKSDIQIQLPKFKFKYDEKKMIPILADMGMTVAFNPSAADFTRINPEGGLYISDVRHKTYIETNEAGSEAAAVTSVEISETSAGNDPQPHYFTVDRPFVFFIHEKTTGTILFIGAVVNPLLD